MFLILKKILMRFFLDKPFTTIIKKQSGRQEMKSVMVWTMVKKKYIRKTRMCVHIDDAILDFSWTCKERNMCS